MLPLSDGKARAPFRAAVCFAPTTPCRSIFIISFSCGFVNDIRDEKEFLTRFFFVLIHFVAHRYTRVAHVRDILQSIRLFFCVDIQRAERKREKQRNRSACVVAVTSCGGEAHAAIGEIGVRNRRVSLSRGQ